MTANESKYYLGYLNKLLDEYNNTYHQSIGKKLIHADYSALTEGVESSCKAPKFKVGDRVSTSKYKNMFCQKLVKRNICYWFYVKANPWTPEIKDLNGETII